MATINTLGVEKLSLRGANNEYHRINRIFRSKAEADAALASGDLVIENGVLNFVIAGVDGLHYYDVSTNTLVNASGALKSYIDTQIAAVGGGAPETMDTLNEISAALADDPQFFSTMSTANAELEQDVDDVNTALGITENATTFGVFAEADLADNTTLKAILSGFAQAYAANKTSVSTSVASVQSQVTANLATAASAVSAESSARIAAVTGEATARAAAILAVQNDVNSNETDADAAISTANLAIAAVQADVNDNETTAANAVIAEATARTTAIGVQNTAMLAAVAVVQADVDTNETDGDAADNALSTRIATLEADPTTATAVANVQTDVDNNEAAALTARNAIQTDVDNNEAAALTARNAIQTDVDANEVTAANADTALSGRLDTLEADPTTKTYVDAQVSGLVDAAPGALDTLNELAAAIADDANFSTTMTNSIAAVQTDVNNNEAAANTAIAAVQTDVDGNETAANAAIAVVQADVDANETAANAAIAVVQADVDANETAANAAIAVVQADVDANETASDAAESALSGRLDTLEADPTTATAVAAVQTAVNANYLTHAAAIAVVQGDVNLNESDADAAIAAVQADVDANETAANAAIAVVQADVNQNEADADAAIAANEVHIDNFASLSGVAKDATDLGTFSGTTINNSSTLKGALQLVETSLENKANISFVQNEIADLIDGAPGVLNTLNEIAAAISDDASISTTLTNLINANEVHIDNAVSLTGVAKDSANLATFTGSTISDNQTIKQALQALESAQEATQADVNTNESDIDTTVAALQADVNQNEADADSAIAAVQADVDANETAANAAIAVVQADVNQNESDADAAIAAETAARNSAVTAVQTDVDNNEAASIASLALKAPLASPALTGTPTAPTAGAGANTTQLATTAYVEAAIATLVDSAPGAINTLNELAAAVGDDANFSTTITNAVNAVQTDVNQNEVDADNAIAAENTAMLAAVAVVQADVNANETASDNAEAALGVRIDSVETEIDTARSNIYDALGTAAEGDTAMGTFTGSTLSDNTTVRALLQELETDTESRLAQAGGQLTGNLTLRKGDGSAVALLMSRADHADMNVVWKVQPSYVSADKEVLTVLANGQVVAHFDERQRFAINMNDPDYTLDVGGDGHFSTNLVVGGTLTLGSTAVTASGTELNYVDGVTSSIQTQLNAIQADVNTNESDADTAIALKANIAGPTFTGVPAAPTASAGTNSTQVATTAYVTTAVANLIDGAPGAINTLNELAAALGDDANFSTTITNMVNANETHIDNAVTLTGVAKDAVNLGTFTGSTVSDSRNVKQALQELETKVEAVQTDVDGNESDADTAIAANETHIDNMATLTGVAKDATNVGNFTGSTISDGGTLKAGIQELETAVELKLAASAVSTFGGTLVDDANAGAARTTLGLGTAATTAATAYATSAQGDTADAALPASGAQAALHVDHIITLSGVAQAADDLGDFSGSTITSDGTIKAGMQELETAVELKAAVAGPTFTGTPAAPTASASTNTTQIATTAFVTTAVAALDAAALRTLLGIVSAANDAGSGLASGQMYFNTGSSKYVLVA